jgi:pSer/pThr/pTyr-binding forkhead associated (FHA) protein
MATLILEQDGLRRGAVLNGRTVIGRRANSHIVIPDRSVSRVHAWIGRAGHTFFIADSGSRTGTRVNGRPVEGRRSLREGDQIQVGSSTITFFAAESLPPGVEPLLSPAEPAFEDEGIFVYCACGAPIWAPWEYGGRSGRCRHCGAAVELPRPPDGTAPFDASNETLAGGMPSQFASARSADAKRSTEVSPPQGEPPRVRLSPDVPIARGNPNRPRRAPSKPAQALPRKPLARPAGLLGIAELNEPPASGMICGACQSPVSMLEPTTTCPDCGVAFHADCWAENRGCSSYGCKQVGALDPKPRPAAQVAPVHHRPEIEEAHATRWASRMRRWEPVLLPASGLIGLAGVFAFGIPSLAIVVGLTAWSLRHPPRKRNLIAFTTILSALMAAAGSALSTYWWLHP